jgi:hypothetical protein
MRSFSNNIIAVIIQILSLNMDIHFISKFIALTLLPLSLIARPNHGGS